MSPNCHATDQKCDWQLCQFFLFLFYARFIPTSEGIMRTKRVDKKVEDLVVSRDIFEGVFPEERVPRNDPRRRRVSF